MSPKTEDRLDRFPLCFPYIDVLVLICLLGFSAVSWRLQNDICTFCHTFDSSQKEHGRSSYVISTTYTCSEEMRGDCNLFIKHSYWSFFLILTHAIPFVLIPLTMRIVYIQTNVPKQVHHGGVSYPVTASNIGLKNPFVMQLGLATIAMSVAFEFGWHVTTTWYYRNNFYLLNFVFYFFMILGFALWADGFYNTLNDDLVFLGLLLLCTVLYPIGAALGNSSLKVPIYIALTYIFYKITIRGLEVLKTWEMYLVPFFTVAVNLYFISLLQGLDENNRTVKNYIYHIAHDLLGTEMGLVVFAYILYKHKGPFDNASTQTEYGTKKLGH